MSAVTRLVLWRHGVTDWNEQGLFQGRADIPLNDKGLAQATAVAPVLAAMSPVAVYCSPMVRARQTAQPLAGLTGLTPVIDDRLAEIDVGTWVGHSVRDVAVLDPAAGEAMMTGRDYRRSLTGETMTEVGLRVGACLRQMALDHDGETVLIVSHGGAIRMGVVNMLGWTYEMASALGGMANCAWSRLNRRSSGWRLDTYNCTAVPGVAQEI